MTTNVSFDKRVSKVVRNHDRMRRNGAVHHVGRDGLIRSRPRLMRPRFPLKGVLVIAVLLIAFKAVMFARLGQADYAVKIEGLRTGSMVEKAGAVVMQQDPLTVALGGYVSQVFIRR